jgi:hypothetical protein
VGHLDLFAVLLRLRFAHQPFASFNPNLRALSGFLIELRTEFGFPPIVAAIVGNINQLVAQYSLRRSITRAYWS